MYFIFATTNSSEDEARTSTTIQPSPPTVGQSAIRVPSTHGNTPERAGEIFEMMEVERASNVANSVNSRTTGVQSLALGNLNLDEIKRILHEAQPKIVTASNKDVIFLIGDKGAGKSTIVNYLLGYKTVLSLNSEDGLAYAESTVPKGAAHAETGKHLGGAKTLFPEVFTTADGRYSYCDCPGFKDNRCEEERICTTIATEMAVRKANRVKVMVVLDDSSFKTDRGEGFVQLSETLGNLLRLEDPRLSILFVVNKASALTTPRQIANRIQQLIDSERKIFQNFFSRLPEKFQNRLRGCCWSEEPLENDTAVEAAHASVLFNEVQKNAQQQEKILKMLTFMKRDGGRHIKVINVFDDFQSAQEINDALGLLPFIEKTLFDFAGFNRARHRFNDAIQEIVSDMCQILKDMKNLPVCLDYYRDQLNDAEKRIAFYVGQLSINEFSSGTENQIAVVRTEINRLQDLIRRNEQNKDRCQNEIGRLTALKNNFDRDDEQILWEDSIKETRYPLVGLFSWTKKDFAYPLADPFTRFEASLLDVDDSSFFATVADAGSKGALGGAAIGTAIAGAPSAGVAAPIGAGLGAAIGGGIAAIGAGIQYGAPRVIHLARRVDKRGEFCNQIVDRDNGVYRSTYLSRVGLPGGAKIVIYCAYNKLIRIVQQIQEANALLISKRDMFHTLIQEYDRLLMDLANLRNREQILKTQDIAAITQQKREFDGRLRDFRDRKAALANSLQLVENKLQDVKERHLNQKSSLEIIYDVVMTSGFDTSYPLFKRFQALYQYINQGGTGPTIELPDNMIDSISTLPLIDPVQTPCQHLFNRLEITEWLSRTHTCPNCRTPVEPRDLISIRSFAELVTSELDRRVAEIHVGEV